VLTSIVTHIRQYHHHTYHHRYYLPKLLSTTITTIICIIIAISNIIGYDISRIREFDKAKPFFRNIFIIKPQILLEISKFIEKAMKVITSDSNLSLLFKVKRTSSSKDKRKKLFDASLNPMKYDYLHSFIFERLPSFFLYNMNNAKVCINEASGPCVANTEFFHYDGNNIVVDKA
jgi:hypothetical protein